MLNESTELRFSAATSTGRTWRPSAPTRPEFTSSVLTGSASGCPLTSRSADYRAGPTTWPDFRATPARWLLRPPDIEAPAGQRPFPLQCYYRRGHPRSSRFSPAKTESLTSANAGPALRSYVRLSPARSGLDRPSTANTRPSFRPPLPVAKCGLYPFAVLLGAPVQALGVDPEQDLDRLPSPLRDVGGRHSPVEPRRHRGVP